MARNGGGGVAWLALLLSVAALFLSWKAYERSGGRLKEDLSVFDRDVSVGEPAEGDWREELARARERLTRSRDKVEAREDLRQVQEDLDRMRKDLARSFRNASEDARQGWQELDRDLERLQGELREGSSKARETLDSALEKMKRVGK